KPWPYLAGKAGAPLRWSRFEQRPGDVPHAAVRLDRIVPAVHVVGGQQPSGLLLHDARIADVPAAAVVAQDKFAAPCRSVVLADAGPDAEGRHAVAIDAGDAPVRHPYQVARRPPVIDARQEGPGAAAVGALEDLGPEHAGRVALAPHRTQDTPVGEQDRPRIEVAMSAE